MYNITFYYYYLAIVTLKTNTVEHDILQQSSGNPSKFHYETYTAMLERSVYRMVKFHDALASTVFD